MPPLLPAKKTRSAAATQEFLPIEAIRDGVVILRGGEGLRAVLMASSLNFALKSEEEQDALTAAYQDFLNSLDFSIQFVVSSRRLNIQPYLETLGARQREETQELIKVQIAEYIEFVRTFVELTQIVAKTFYVVVPFQPSIAERRSGIFKGFTSLFERGGRGTEAGEGGEEFAKFKSQLLQRVDAVSVGLQRLGLRVAQLSTEELVELFYGLYNPTESQRVQTAGEETVNSEPEMK